MKKTLLAAALMAGFAGVAQAETSVTLYGILDGGIGYERMSGNTSYNPNTTTQNFTEKRTGMISGVQYGNRWGLKGAEDLGNGLRAVFVLESGFNLFDGSQAQGGRLFGRQATLGLASDSWGQLDLGRQTNIASKYLAPVASPFGAGFAQANAGVVFNSANTIRYDNMIMYQTPNFSGFQFGVGYSFNNDGAQAYKEDGDRNPNGRAITAGIRYAGGPLAVALTYDQLKKAGVDAGTTVIDRTNQIGFEGSKPIYGTQVSPGTEDTTVKAWALAGSYDFEIVKLYAGFGQTRDGFFSAHNYNGAINGATSAFSSAGGGVNGKGLKFNSYSLGVSAPVGNGTVMASWMMADPRSEPNAWNVTANDPRELDKQQTYSVGYTYDLSKRTNLYAIGSYTKHVNFLPDAKATLLGVGLVHKF